MTFRPIANPRRTTLAHLKDIAERQPQTPVDRDTDTTDAAEAATEARQLPQRTANPRRTVLMKLPGAQ